MRRVLHVLFDASLSGGQVAAMRLGVALREHGWDSEYLLPADGPLTSALENADLPYEITALRSHVLSDGRRYYGAFSSKRPDVVHAHLVLPTQLSARLAAAIARLPLICHYHIAPSLPAGRCRSAVYSLIDRYGARWMTKSNLAVSPEIFATLRSDGYRRIELVPNGVPIPEVIASAPRHGPIVQLGRVTHQKGQDLAIRAVAELARSSVHTPLLRIIGDPGSDVDRRYADGLRDLPPGLHEDCVEFVGAYAEAAKVELAGAGCLVFPSRSREGTPLSVLEAMAAGVPVVGADIPGVRELLDNGAGLLFREDDPASLADALRLLARNEDLRGQIIHNARRRIVTDYPLSLMAERVTIAYEAALAL